MPFPVGQPRLPHSWLRELGSTSEIPTETAAYTQHPHLPTALMVLGLMLPPVSCSEILHQRRQTGCEESRREKVNVGNKEKFWGQHELGMVTKRKAAAGERRRGKMSLRARYGVGD